MAHCGGSLSGQFAWTLIVADVFSGWTNNQAFLGKTADNTLSAIIRIEKLLPYRETKPDCISIRIIDLHFLHAPWLIIQLILKRSIFFFEFNKK